MKINELRIENFIQVPYGDEEPWIRKVDYLSGDFVVTENGRYCNDDEFDFAPLTEEWLLKFGFKFTDWLGSWDLKDGSFGLVKTHNQTFILESTSRSPEIKYIHQLQNLYFCLTGQELTFK